MKSSQRKLPSIILSLIVLNAGAAVRYVDVNSANPASPYTNWATAATTIQQAIDVALAGDEILVTNGVYQTGARAVYGTSNRVAVTKPVTVRSVNGPAVTQIMGYQVPGTTNGTAAVRCVYLTNGAVLAGFTLANGATPASGNTNTNQSGGGVWCEGLSAVVSNCVLTGNAAYYTGGGAFRGTLNDCTLSNNAAGSNGGGAYLSNLKKCILTDNSSGYSGGGASGGTLNNCTLSGNSAYYDGGGGAGGTLTDCTLTGNSAGRNGGGLGDGTMNNCTLTGNSAGNYGGGAYGGTLNNCTLTGNASGRSGGGAFAGALTNCIVYYNSATFGSDNYDRGANGITHYCCTTPLSEGAGILAEDPQLASTSHLSAGSPCIGRGNATSASGVDVDGEPWANPPSIGCDEYWSGSVTGTLSVAIMATYTNVAVGFAVGFQALIGGQVSASHWDFGDGSMVTNRPYASHAWAAVGDYVVELRAYNESYPMGVVATVTVHVVQEEHYVAKISANPVPPYSSWATAATNIQDAVDAATLPGALVWVSNGVYQTGARAVYGMNNRLAVTKPVTVQSVNGPAYTTIVGYRHPSTTNGSSAIRCVYLTNGAVLAGFTLTNGATQSLGDNLRNRSGGGVWCESMNATVSNCVLAGNSANYFGGGALSGTFNNCTLTGNSAAYGGGANGGMLNNCIAFYNSAPIGSNYYDSAFNYSCTMPLPSGTGSITNEPLFVNIIGWSNLRLQSNSPCINAGNNAFAPGPTDLNGNARIVAGTVDMGAYEFQTPASAISYAWLQQYGLPTDGTADFADSDGEGLNNWQEWRAGTVPTNALSALRMLSPTGSASGITLSWESVNTRNYWLERATNLAPQPVFSIIAPNLPGQAGTTTYTDTNATVTGPFFYRVGVQP